MSAFLEQPLDPSSLPLRRPKIEFRRQKIKLPVSVVAPVGCQCIAEPSPRVRDMAEFLFPESPENKLKEELSHAHKYTPALPYAHTAASIPDEEVAMAESKKAKPATGKRKGITRFPLEIKDELAKEFEETRLRVFPLAGRNAVLCELVTKFVKENK